MDLVFSKSATRALRAMPQKQALAMIDRLRRIAQDPFAQHANVEPLKGVADAFRLRQGDRRALYVVDRAQNQMRVERIAARGDAYR